MTAIMTLVYGVGQIVGPGLAGSLYAQSHSFNSSLLAAAGALARHGVLVRRLDALEALAGIDTLVFDPSFAPHVQKIVERVPIPDELVPVASRALVHYVFGHAFEEQTARQAVSLGAVERSLESLPDFDLGLDLVEEILELKRERNAVILAHNYMTPDIFHGVGDFVGALANYGKEEKMRLAAWLAVDCVLPLGPDFIQKILEALDGPLELQHANELRLLLRGESVVDLQIGYTFPDKSFLKGLSLLFQVSNANDAPFIRYRDTPSNQIENTKYGKTYLFGLNYKL